MAPNKLSLPPEYSRTDNRRPPIFIGSLEDVIPETHKHGTCYALRVLRTNLTTIIGDKICIFGFSHGAYTARGLAGIRAASSSQPPSFSLDVDIEFLGLWEVVVSQNEPGTSTRSKWIRSFSRDTVASIGFINRRLPLNSSNNTVRYFRHALSLDEHRARFVPSLWSWMHGLPQHQSEPHLSLQFGVPDGAMPKSSPKQRDQETSQRRSANSTMSSSDSDKALNELEQEFDATIDVDSSSQASTHVEEAWFAGCHCDVGGWWILVSKLIVP
ncbi:hypothetical protein GYMLUDRAFT_243967 [Collybiopsis luxurians FD-317 M1]|uniref:T6SS Phospholipase effector Tle1-like catalytic domain-containing protein n=1 Tax=Collybiopsis luxurians FD-317 M1 TaxID=944289 RepID=A0A0D0CE59_9AGAR|nr:hypothetical protein GYMLUDRAFT_243967 [Collybiopsis luxurians FD-317 M1]